MAAAGAACTERDRCAPVGGVGLADVDEPEPRLGSPAAHRTPHPPAHRGAHRTPRQHRGVRPLTLAQVGGPLGTPQALRDIREAYADPHPDGPAAA
nr:hypothetical protein [Frankia sp. ArI3]